MELISAINALVALTTAATNAASTATQVSAIIQKAAAEGRTTLSADEEAVVKGVDDAARAQLVQELNRRLS